MEHEARFARLREGHLVRDTDPQGTGSSITELVRSVVAIVAVSAMALVGFLLWLLG